RDVVVLPDRRLKLRLVDQRPGGAERIQPRARRRFVVAPRWVTQSDGDGIGAQASQEPLEVRARVGTRMEARWKLREHRSEPTAVRQGANARATQIDASTR